MNKIYPSSCMPTFGQTTFGYKEACPRYFWASREFPEPREELDPLYGAIGRIAEERVKLQLETSLRGDQALIIEHPVKHEINENWTISGRVDAFIQDLTVPADSVVWEIKATLSKWRWANMIKGTETDPKHLAQLVTYMTLLGVRNGVLSSSYLHFDRKLKSLQFETKELKVRIESADKLTINDEIWAMYTPSDCLKFYQLMIQATELPSLPAKVVNDRACSSCPYTAVCGSGVGTKQGFRELVAAGAKSQPPGLPAPRIEKHDIRG